MRVPLAEAVRHIRRRMAERPAVPAESFDRISKEDFEYPLRSEQ